MKKFLIALLCVLFISPFTFVACKKTDANVVRVNEVTHSIFYAPLYIAINNGYFEEYDIEIELTHGGGADKSMAALVSNSADIGLMGPEAAIYVAEQGKQDLHMQHRDRRREEAERLSLCRFLQEVQLLHILRGMQRMNLRMQEPYL